MRWRRLRKWAKWTCTVVAGLTVALAVFSRFYRCQYLIVRNTGDTAYVAILGSGLLQADRMDGLNDAQVAPPLGWQISRSDIWLWGRSGEVRGPGNTRQWSAGVLSTRHAYGWEVGVSMMYPAAFTLAPAALLWYADRRRFGAGSCKRCGYDRAGLAPDAKCPECGTVPAPAAK